MSKSLLDTDVLSEIIKGKNTAIVAKAKALSPSRRPAAKWAQPRSICFDATTATKSTGEARLLRSSRMMSLLRDSIRSLS